jgi:hypothetical protein
MLYNVKGYEYLCITVSMYCQHPGKYEFRIFSRRTWLLITEFIMKLHYEANVRSRAVPIKLCTT